MKSNLLSKSESAQVISEISGAWGLELPRTKNVMIHDLGGGASLVSGSGFRALGTGRPAADAAAPAAKGGPAGPGPSAAAAAAADDPTADAAHAAPAPAYLPFLSEDALLARFPAVTVDMGAVRFVCKGANVMRPGITAADAFEAGDIVCVREESRGRYLAVGTADLSGGEAAASGRGQAVTTLHYISDRYWEAARPALGGS